MIIDKDACISMTQFLLLKTLVGSQAHGLATPESDNDYRGVFVVPTTDLLSLHYKPQTTSWLEGKEDDTSYEVGHFLHLATQCNPTILEVFRAPVIEHDRFDWGGTIRHMFADIWEPKRVADAFGGYSLNQRKKFLDDKDRRKWKYAVAYVRVLLQGIELLQTGDFHVEVQDQYPIADHRDGWAPFLSCGVMFQPNIEGDWPTFLRQVKDGRVSTGDVVNTAEGLRTHLHHLAENGPYKDKKADLERVNNMLIDLRNFFWRLLV